MVIWFTTAPPAVKAVCDRTGCTGVLVMEDTFPLRPDVAYAAVAAEVKKACAGVFGYGNRWRKEDGRGGWHGVKGVFMTPDWCEEMSFIMLNTHFQHFQHVDMWLSDLIRRQKARGFQLLEPLAGYGHRVSMSESAGTSSKFGGAWLPQIPGGDGCQKPAWTS